MPYKPELMEALRSDYGDAARRYMEQRNHDAEAAEGQLDLMCVIAKNMKYTQQMMDGTLGRAYAGHATHGMTTGAMMSP